MTPQLLTRDPTRRLGAGPDDAEEIKRHPFFEDVNWDDMLNKRVPPPFLPTIKSATDSASAIRDLADSRSEQSVEHCARSD